MKKEADSTEKKKEYNSPVLSDLGDIPEITTGGSNNHPEFGPPGNGNGNGHGHAYGHGPRG